MHPETTTPKQHDGVRIFKMAAAKSKIADMENIIC